MAKNITIKVPGKHPHTGELTTFELKGQRMDIDIGGQAVPFLIHGKGIGTSLTRIPSCYRIALLGGWLNTTRCTCWCQLNCKPTINVSSLIKFAYHNLSIWPQIIKGQPFQAGLLCRLSSSR